MVSNRILVIRGGAIGDFVLTLPVLQALRDTFPKAELEVLGYPHIATLAEAAGLVARSTPIEAQALAGFFARNGTLDPDWVDYFSDFEIIISYLYDPDAIFQNNVVICGPARFIQGPYRPVETENIHATRVFLRPLEQLAIFDSESRPRISLTEPPNRLDPKHPWLALHPGSGSSKKNWPLERWLTLIKSLLQDTSWHLLLIGGEAERPTIERIQAETNNPRVHVKLCAPLVEVAEDLAHCQGFVGHDSGISHLAAALNLPGLVLWGPSNVAIWRPHSDQVVVIQHENGLSELPVDQVAARIPPPR